MDVGAPGLCGRLGETSFFPGAADRLPTPIDRLGSVPSQNRQLRRTVRRGARLQSTQPSRRNCRVTGSFQRVSGVWMRAAGCSVTTMSSSSTSSP
jgi:hypothetical protein